MVSATSGIPEREVKNRLAQGESARIRQMARFGLGDLVRRAGRCSECGAGPRPGPPPCLLDLVVVAPAVGGHDDLPAVLCEEGEFGVPRPLATFASSLPDSSGRLSLSQPARRDLIGQLSLLTFAGQFRQFIRRAGGNLTCVDPLPNILGQPQQRQARLTCDAGTRRFSAICLPFQPLSCINDANARASSSGLRSSRSRFSIICCSSTSDARQVVCVKIAFNRWQACLFRRPPASLAGDDHPFAEDVGPTNSNWRQLPLVADAGGQTVQRFRRKLAAGLFWIGDDLVHVHGAEAVNGPAADVPGMRRRTEARFPVVERRPMDSRTCSSTLASVLRVLAIRRRFAPQSSDEFVLQSRIRAGSSNGLPSSAGRSASPAGGKPTRL